MLLECPQEARGRQSSALQVKGTHLAQWKGGHENAIAFDDTLKSIQPDAPGMASIIAYMRSLYAGLEWRQEVERALTYTSQGLDALGMRIFHDIDHDVFGERKRSGRSGLSARNVHGGHWGGGKKGERGDGNGGCRFEETRRIASKRAKVKIDQLWRQHYALYKTRRGSIRRRMMSALKIQIKRGLEDNWKIVVLAQNTSTIC